MNERVCTRCKFSFPATNEHFTKSAKGKYGLNSVCKECSKAIWLENSDRNKKKTKEYYEANKEAFAERARAYRAENKERIFERNKQYREANRERVQEYMTDYQKKNADRLRITRSIYREKNAEKISKSKRLWHKRNPENARASFHRRRTKAKALPHNYKPMQWKKCKEYFNSCCAYCGKEDELSQDHFLALSKGGEYTKDNIIPACKSCNSSKGNRNFFEWYPNHKSHSKIREQKILKYLNYHNNTQQLSIL